MRCFGIDLELCYLEYLCYFFSYCCLNSYSFFTHIFPNFQCPSISFDIELNSFSSSSEKCLRLLFLFFSLSSRCSMLSHHKSVILLPKKSLYFFNFPNPFLLELICKTRCLPVPGNPVFLDVH